MDANIKMMKSQNHAELARYEEVARILTGNRTATVDDGVKWVRYVVSELSIPPLSSHGMTESHIPEAVQKTLNASSYKGNPIQLSETILAEILEKAL